MTTITLDIEKLKAAMVITDEDKKNISYQGIYLDSDNCRLVSTDNHIIYIANKIETFDKPVRLPKFKIPAKAESATITDMGNNLYEIKFRVGSIKNLTETSLLVYAINHPYPRYSAALNLISENTVNNIGINLSLIEKVAKVFSHSTLTFTSKTSVVYITSESNPDELIGVMPLNRQHELTVEKLIEFGYSDTN